MQARTLVVGGLVLVALLVGTQVAFTGVGQPVSPLFSEPTEATVFGTGPDTYVVDVAADGDDGGGAVAWTERRGDRFRVRVARTEIADGTVTVGEPRTLASADAALTSLDVAVRGGEVAVVWERTAGNDVVLARPSAGTTRVVSDDPLRVEQPAVALVDGGTVVAWRQYRDGEFDVRLATLPGGPAADGAVVRRFVGGPSAGIGSPSLSAAGDGFAVTYLDADESVAVTRFGRLTADGAALGSRVVLGDARAAGGFGGGGQAALGSDANATAVRGVWVDVSSVLTGTATREGPVRSAADLGPGDRPGVAVLGGDWLAAWLVQSPSTGADVLFADAAGRRGQLSRLPSSAADPSPLFAPEAGVAWSERGVENRVLVAAALDRPRGGTVDRLAREPAQFGFVTLTAAVVGLVTVPILPWVFFAVAGAFYATSRTVNGLALRLVARLGGLSGERPDPRVLRERFEAVPAVVWLVVFAAWEVALLTVLLGPSTSATSISFSSPVAVSLGALLGTIAVGWVGRVDSPWRVVGVFVYLQTAALWATALPTIL